MNIKKLALLASALSLAVTLNAQKYYISASDPNANDTYTVTSVSTPWKTFSPLNALLATNNPIDTIFLKCGDTFRDQINVNVPGDFVITSYGTGNKPVISGADTVKPWTPIADFWQAGFTSQAVNFFVAGKEQILAREPDAGAAIPYMSVDAAATTYLQDASLASIPISILDRSQVCVHTEQWCWEKSPVSCTNSIQITYDTPTIRVPTAGYGYFLYDDTTYLTTGKEWKYDATAQKIYYKPSSGNPNSLFCEASVRSYGILLASGISGVTVLNISFEKQAESGVAILNSNNDNIQIANCNFSGQYKYGVDVQGKNTNISYCYFREVDGLGIYIHANGFKAQVHHNTFRNNGGFRNSGIGQEINLSSIKGGFVDSCHIHHNDIDSAGYCGISMDGKYNTIERNIVKNAMLLNNDGAALKSFGTGSKYNVFRNNFVSKSDGNMAGTPGNANFVTPAIYFDFSTNNCTIQENTIYDRTKKGIFLNASTNNNTVVGNVVYGGNTSLDYNGAPNSNIFPYVNMTGMTVKKNSFFSKDPNGYIIRMIDNTGYAHGVIDSNYYFQPYDSTKYVLFAATPASDSSFYYWKSVTGYDANSRGSFVDWTLPTSDDTLIMNQTDNVVSVNLGTTKFLDLDSNDVCGSIILQPYTSKILINTNSNCTTGLQEFSSLNSAKLFPNPTMDEIHIYNLPNASTRYRVLNVLGNVVANGDLPNTKAKISVCELPSGMYFIQLTGNGFHTIKFLKK